MDGDGLVRLANERFELLLSPRAGGSILRFDWIEGGVSKPLLRGCNATPENILDVANFPLVPFVNRIRGGLFTFRGREVRLSPNLSGDPSPLHGQGWLGAWETASASQTEAVLAFRHAPGEWPWAYEARQRFALDAAGLALTLSCRNLSDEPMPCGLGQHPYFPCTPETRLDTEVSHVWTIDEHVLPVDKVQAAGRYDLRDRRICGQELDHGFAGWGGRALIRTPGDPFEIEVTSPQARFFQVYSPKQGGLFVAEPVSHANAAMNAPEDEWEALGLRVLEPGEAMSLDSRIDGRSIPASA